jgi:hypothetical protein
VYQARCNEAVPERISAQGLFPEIETREAA